MAVNVGQTLFTLAERELWEHEDTLRIVESAYGLYRDAVDAETTTATEHGLMLLIEERLVETLQSIRGRDATYARIVALAAALVRTRERADRLEKELT